MTNPLTKLYYKNKKRRVSGSTTTVAGSKWSRNSVQSSGSISRTLPMSRVLRISDRRICTVPVRSQVNYSFQTSGGVGLLGTGTTPDILFAVQQNYFVGVQNNSSWFQAGGSFANAANCAAVFQQYRITKFQVDVYYSANNVAIQSSAVSNAALPIVYVVDDRENARSILTPTIALQYASCRTMQMGNSSGESNGRQSIVMNSPSCFGAVDNDSSLLGTIQQATILKSPWLACGTNSITGQPANIPHGCIKLVIDPVNSATSQYLGNFTFVLSAVIEYRGID